MNIAVNGKPFAVVEKGGAVRVALNVVRHVARLRPDFRFQVYVPVQDSTVPTPEFPANVTVQRIQARWYRSGWARSIFEQLVLPFRVHQADHDLLINLTNSLPVLLSPGIPQVLLLHDIGFLDRRWFSRTYSGYVAAVLRMAAGRGAHFVTVSETSAEQIRRAFPRVRHVTAIPNAADSAPAESGTAPARNSYLLFIGSLNPRKNLAGAVEGFRRYLADRPGTELRLLVVGAEKPIFGGRSPDRERGPAGVEYLGYVDDAEKWALLRGARALLLPSFLEGFGLPILEALQVGTPVVASDIPVFHELYGDAVEYVSPNSPEDIARGISVVLDRPDVRARLVELGRQRAGQFSWRRSAQRYADLFERVARRPRPSSADTQDLEASSTGGGA